MRIVSMTATFGKLEHESLTLKPGLNVIHAPNEWGKSTWCAFLLSMLYGIDTGAKRSKAAPLPDKERYQGWSGLPMSGRMDLVWQGRNITLERTTKGRIPLGQFRAYETDTGIPVPELTAENCGKVLLGESREVYSRSGFIRFSDLPVTGDEGFRARLNALVTTGEDTPEMRKLEQGLRNLKNRCRYNQSGRLPQLEEAQRETEELLRQREALESGIRENREALLSAQETLEALENHQTALAWEKFCREQQRLDKAYSAWQATDKKAAQLAASAASMPEEAVLRHSLEALQAFEIDRNLHLRRTPPEKPVSPAPPPAFARMTGNQAKTRAREDTEEYTRKGQPLWLLPMLLGGIALIAGVFLALTDGGWPVATCAAVGSLLLAAGFVLLWRSRRTRESLLEKYGYRSADTWIGLAQSYAAGMEAYSAAYSRWESACREYREEEARLAAQKKQLCGSREPEETRALLEKALRLHEDTRQAGREAETAHRHYADLKAMTTPAEKPKKEDSLTLTPEETQTAIAAARQTRRMTQSAVDRGEGALQKLPGRAELEARLAEGEKKIREVSRICDAAELALNCLEEAKRSLQRRFAPRITGSARELMGRITGGRYDRLTLQEDFSVQAAASGEDILHPLSWRSAGTADQLYLALRLAIARELMPDAPLILDDALVRCDDVRMGAVMEILKEMSENRQVLLFTCQTREQQWLEEAGENPS